MDGKLRSSEGTIPAIPADGVCVEPLKDTRRQTREQTRWGAVAATVVATLAAVTPAFTVGALSGPITSELGTSTASFGVALALFFAGTALGSPISARLAERLGAAWQFAAATTLAGAVMVGLAGVSSFAALASLLAAGGLANSLVGPAAGLVLGSSVAPRRLSVASGMVQAALAAPPLSAGLAVRFLAEPYGWRSALLVGGLLVGLTAAASVLARDRDRSGSRASAPYSANRRDDRPTARMNAGGRLPLVLWATGAALGTVGVTATASFFVPITVEGGFSAATAGLFALGAGAFAAVVRVGVGTLADLRPRSNPAAVVVMMLAGGAGLVLISVGAPGTFLAGTLVVVGGLWGWNGLLVASAVRLLPASPARSLGVLQVGFFSGATAAPLVFGTLSEAVGTAGALLALAVSAASGAAAVAAGDFYRRLREE